MKIGICRLMTEYCFDVITLARKLEALGFESLWAPEHGAIPLDCKTGVPASAEKGVPIIYQHGHINHIMDPFAWLGAVAAATERLKLGTGICLVPERDPIHTAKQVATVDGLCGGRFQFGIGAGWLRGESEVFGVDFPRRWSQTRDYMLAMKSLWGEEISEYEGEYVRFPKLVCSPKPVQRPHPPILIAGEGERCMERIVDYGDGWVPRGAPYFAIQRPRPAGAGPQALRGVVRVARARPRPLQHHRLGRQARPGAQPELLRCRSRPGGAHRHHRGRGGSPPATGRGGGRGIVGGFLGNAAPCLARLAGKRLRMTAKRRQAASRTVKIQSNFSNYR